MRSESYNRDGLLFQAREVAKNAHCRFSHFRVGAIVVANGKIYKGANIEVSSYGLALCAERSALAAALSSGSRDITHIAVSCIDADKNMGIEQLIPCGACRQWLGDFAPQATIIVDGVEKDFKLADIFPFPFRI